MKNNKGFSILELIVSFSICMVVVVILFQIVVVLKEVYEKSSVKTELLNKQNLIIDQIYTDILDKGLSNEGIESCGSKCVKFTFDNDTSKTFQYTSNNLQYGDYATTLNNGSTVSDIVITNNEDVVGIYLKITHKLFLNTDFGIRVVHFVK